MLTCLHSPKVINLWKAQSWEENTEGTEIVLGMRFIVHIILKVCLQTEQTSHSSFLCGQRKATVTLVQVTSLPHLGKRAPAPICPWLVLSCSSHQNELSNRIQSHEILKILWVHKSINTPSHLPWLLESRTQLRELEFIFVIYELVGTLYTVSHLIPITILLGISQFLLRLRVFVRLPWLHNG